MVTIANRGAYTWTFYGKSTDVKPTEWEGSKIPVNSFFLEVDTQTLFYFDADEIWKVSGSK